MSIRILHLEDDPMDAALIEEALRRDQLDVIVHRVSDRADFIAALDDGPLDIILSDYDLPSYDGLSALAEARNRAPDAPFVFVSGALGEERAVEAMKAGATDFVLKQHLARLAPAFRRALQESADRRARLQAEEALEDSRRFVESVIEATPQVLFVFDPKTRSSVYLNPKIADALGYSPEALHAMGPGVLDALVHPLDRVELESDFAALATGAKGLVIEREHRIRDATGRWRWFASRSVPFRSPRGHAQILGTAEDVTDRRRVDRQRRIQYTVSRILATETTAEPAFTRILEGLCGDLEFAVGEVWENDPEGRHRRRAVWHDPPRAAAAAWLGDSATRALKPALTIPGRVVASARSHWIHDIGDDPAYLRDDGATSMGLHSAVAVPLRTGPDVLGVLVLFSTERLEADEDLVATLEALAAQIAEFWSRTRAERDRLESEEKFRSIVETTSEWIWAVDASFVLTYSNPAVKRILGYDAAQMIGRDRHAFVHVEDREAVEVECERLALQRRGWDGIVVRWRHRDGSIRHLESTAVPVLDGNGAMAGYRGSDRDITARMEIEEKLREQAMLLENAVEATLLTDTEGRVRFWNRGAAELYEWTAHEAIGRDIAELFPGSPEQTYEARKRVLQGGSWTGMIHQRSRSGRDIAVQSRWSPVRGDDGRVRSILILNSDVTEAQRLEARLLRSQRMEGIGTLAGGIAHDLNNVLAPILMAIEVLGRKVTDPHGKRMLSILETSARRGADLVKQVLTFARGASGPAGLLDPAHIIREMERMARETFPKSIEVHAEVPRDLWQVLGQGTPLQQVLMNLCVNARDAMPDGGTLTLRAWNAPAVGDPADDSRGGKAHVVIEVADTGTGIPPEVVDRIFDPFFTTKPMGEGTGLGLSTTAAIVKSHEGFIDVDTALGKGTAFKVFLPAHAAAVPAAVSLEAAMPEGHGQLILLIDDEAAILNIARETLEVYGYSVITASSGEAALGIFRERRKDIRLAVTDMSMPGLSGPATIQALRAIDPTVLIVATSGRPLEGPETLPIQGFLSKPYSARTLLETVQATIAAR